MRDHYFVITKHTGKDSTVRILTSPKGAVLSSQVFTGSDKSFNRADDVRSEWIKAEIKRLKNIGSLSESATLMDGE
jgi:hypothetical protein